MYSYQKEDGRNINKNPDISLKILKEVTRRLAETETLAQNLATNDVDARIAHMIFRFW